MVRRIAAVSAAVATVVITGVCAYLVGESHAETATWHTGRASLGAHEMSVRVHGWTYGVQDTVPWVDTTGSYHDVGWPDCVDVPPGTQRTVRFASVKVKVDGTESRPIVMIDCRGNQ